jgi:hypothetical protein
MDEKVELMDGVVSVLEVDPFSDKLVNLYLQKRFWEYLARRFGGNKITVTIRGSFEVPAHVVEAQDEAVMKVFFKGE